ncbi:thiopurine S-methyltransferase [Synechococcus sp. RSCCF101]|uniref:thiopurine S-methyltransferase n=1 Tax=Synechococcus sp. RSCCF101 TaxID=2511069 RepID=UPI001CD99334
MHRWDTNQIAFHQPEGHFLLRKWFHKLPLKKGQTVFIPLCGKSHDLSWLLSQGMTVVGSELSSLAIDQLFDDLGLIPAITQVNSFRIYSASRLVVYVGDFFDLTADVLGPVQAVYDRAALVALPHHMRSRYSEHLLELSNSSPQLLITFDYSQVLMEGPPFSVGADEVTSLYASSFDTELLEELPVPGGFKGATPFTEQIWYLS